MKPDQIKRSYRKLLEENHRMFSERKESLLREIAMLVDTVAECNAQIEWCEEERDKLLKDE